MKIHFTASHSSLAQSALAEMTKTYGQSALDKADVCVVLGGDGQTLSSLYDSLESGKPVFAMRRTESIGFLCNSFEPAQLEQRIQKAQSVTLHPLRLEAERLDGSKFAASAINEISILRETPQAVRLRIVIDGIERVSKYSGDGILIATPAGSTAYNHSCGGPIMPLNANTLIITAICGFRPRGWSYAVLPQDAVTEIDILETSKRPARIEAGISVFHNASKARIWLDRSKKISLLFDPDQHLDERIIREQFLL